MLMTAFYVSPIVPVRFILDFLLKKVGKMFGQNLNSPYLCIRFPKGTRFKTIFDTISYRQVVRRAYLFIQVCPRVIRTVNDKT